ncbi:CotH kinase family protein [Eubacterium sp.]|uniref:CotH kinase family protein n=1 Tax=Eubacterium sp. TaxID=142586 RepID=UPI0025DA3BD0|nr:CotH kinase family protein [Eubacterium sp.]MCR5628419.1 CotH kinase family protein [Eubacterium sp.]
MRYKSKFGKVIAKATAFALAFAMSLPTGVYADLDFGEELNSSMYEDGITVDNLQYVIDEAIEKGVPSAFIKHFFADDLNMIDNSKIDLEEGEAKPKIKVSEVINTFGARGLEIKKIDTGLLARTKLYLGKYDFDDMDANRLVYNMLGKKNLSAKAYFYLDNDEDAFAEIKLKRSGDSDWEQTRNYTVDVRNLNLKGNHKVYLKVVADDAIDGDGKIIANTDSKTSIYLESMFFIEGSTPVLDFDLDTDFPGIEAVNGSKYHTVESTGDMYTEIKGEDKDQKYELEYIRGRGNSTWQASKKPYKVKFDKKIDLFGMGANKHWILLANYYDYTLLRNRITFDIANKLGLDYTPESVGVNLIINGEYYGSYQLAEQIRVGESRVDIDDLEKLKKGENPTDPEIITGGYLINMGGSWLTSEGEEEKINTTPYKFVIEGPEYEAGYSEEGKKAQIKYINNYFAIIDKLISDLEPMKKNKNNLESLVSTTEDGIEDAKKIDEEELDIPEGATWRDYMDEQSLIDYYLIQEFSRNGDAYSGGSTYLYKPRNGKLFWGPVWDFDFVAWNSTHTDESNSDGYVLTSRAPWVERLLLSDEEFVKNVTNRWKVLKPILEEMIKDEGTLDQFAKETYMSALANYQVKRSYLMGDYETSEYAKKGDTVNFDSEGNVYTLNYANEISRLKDFISKRIEFFDDTIENIIDNTELLDSKFITLFFLGHDNEEPYERIQVHVEQNEEGVWGYISEEKMPEDPKREGYEFLGWYYTDNDGNIVRYTPGENIILKEEWRGETDYYASNLYARFRPCNAVKVEKVEFLSDTFYHYIPSLDEYNDEIEYFESTAISFTDLIDYEPSEAYLADIEFRELTPEDEKTRISDNLITAVEPDEVTVIAYLDDKELARAKIVFTDDKSKFVNPGDFIVDKQIKLKSGETKKIETKYEEGKYLDCAENSYFRYVSSDESVATVSEDGKIVAKADGVAKIVVVNYSGLGNVAKIIKVIVGSGKKAEEAKKDENKSEATKAPVVGTTLKDKTFKLKVTKAASDDKKVAGEVKITGLVKKNTKKAVIKSTVTIDGYKYNVTEIGAKAFAKAKKLTKVIIKGNKLPKIGKKAFFKKGKKVTIKVNKKLVKKAKKAFKKAKCKGYKVK